MKPLQIDKTKTEMLFPDKITADFSIIKLLTINHHNAVFQAISKVSGKSYVIKVLDKHYYDKKLYRQIFQIKNSFLLLPKEYFSNHEFCYFLYPQFLTLTEWLSTKYFTYQMLRTLITEIGTAIAALHKHNIAHLDISPNNIFIHEDKHFLLGDFSSSCHTKAHPANGISPALRTGYSTLFTGNFTTDNAMTPFEIDRISFCTLLYLLTNNGELSDNTNHYSDTFNTLHSFLRKEMTTDSHIEKNNRKEFMNELENIMSLCDKDHACQSYSLHLSKKQCNTLFEATPEYPITPSLSSQKKGKSLHFPHPSFSSAIPLYSLLFLCGFLFLFSVYHYLSQNSNSTKNNIIRPTPDNEASISVTSTPPSDGRLFPTNSQAPLPDGRLFPTNSQTPSPVKNILKLSGKKSNTTAFLKPLKKCNSLQILFANSCELSSCHSFAHLSNLNELYLHNNRLNSINDLTSLKNLQVLVLSKNNLTDISPLARLKNLTILDFSDNHHLKNITSLADLSKLRYLILTNTNVTKKEALFLQKKLPHCTIFY